jgi:hypothetical protein
LTDDIAGDIVDLNPQSPRGFVTREYSEPLATDARVTARPPDGSTGRGGKKLERRAQTIWDMIRDPDRHSELRPEDLEWFLRQCQFTIKPTRMGCIIGHMKLEPYRTEYHPVVLHRRSKRQGYYVCHKALRYLEEQVLRLIELGELDLELGD